MKLSPKIKKITTIFLLVNILQSVILPAVAHALTSGPTAPEASSFEPIDTTDMVNLQTGDFTYSIPLLEVPSPEGGYPLALAYHGGVKPLEEASWVGLGWSLSPGAISRVVSGYPDDQVGAFREVTDRWNGGETKSFSIGTTIGIPKSPVGFSLAYTATTDTYKGFSGDISLGVNVGLNIGNAQIGGGVNASIANGTSTYAGVGLNIGGGGTMAASLGLSVSSSGGFGGSVGLNSGYTNEKGNFVATQNVSDVSFTMSSKGLKPSVSAAGAQINSVNNNYGNISTQSFGFTLPIPVPWGSVNLSYSHTRYWMDVRDQTYVTGSLQTNEFDSSISGSVSSTNNQYKLINSSSQYSFDRVGLTEQTTSPPYTSVGSYNDPSWLLAGSMPAFDAYQVTGQGLSGTMRPHVFEHYSMVSKVESLLDGANRYNATQYHRIQPSNISKVQFRFDNDFSNYYTTTGSSIYFNSLSYPSNVTASSHVSNASTPASTSTVTYFNSTNRTLAGSKHVEWFSNAEINAGTATSKGFINYPGVSSGDRTTKFSDNVSKQIGGYSITNENGVTYHYALPVYAYDEIIDATVNGMGTTMNHQDNPHPYAYTWLLTAITGPDFVDRGGSGGTANGLLDENDWGYWVSFDYGRWVENFKWRLPATGTMRDINGSVQRYSSGTKELYYLDAIKTRTHTALFIKDIRKDSKGVTSSNGGFSPQQTVVCFDSEPYPYTAPTSFPLSTLRLKSIMLLKNEALQNLSITVNSLKDDGSLYDEVQVWYPYQCGLGTYFTVPLHTSDNVIDVTDIQGSTGTNLTSNSLKIVELDNDYYDLCPLTSNSLDNTSIYSTTPSEVYNGKLTLKSVKFKGKGGVDYLPPLKFYYDYQNPTSYNFTIAQGLGLPGPNKFKISISNADANLKVGDIIKHSSGNWYAAIAETTTGCSSGTCYNAILINGSNPSTGQTGSFVRTKNPPFSYHKLDFWGNYKCDFFGDNNIAENDFKRRTSKLSKDNLDAWSLRSIETSLGATINVNYEPRTFNQSAFNKMEIENVSVTKITDRIVDITGLDFSANEVFVVNQDIQFAIGHDQTCSGTFTPRSFWASVTSITPSTNTVRLTIKPYEPNICNLYSSAGFIYFSSFYQESLGTSDVANADGIRIKSISVQSPQFTSATEYTYIDGVTSYIPSGGDTGPSYCCGTVSTEKAFVNLFTTQMGGVPSYSLFAPSPGTLYKQVEIKEKINGVLKPEYRRYYFKTFDPVNMLQITRGGYTTNNVFYSGWFQSAQVISREITITDKTSGVGTLEKIETYNSLAQVVGKTEYNYVFGTDGTPTNQGVIHQEFNELWTKEPGYNQPNYGLATVTRIKKYPQYLASTTTTDNGITNTTYNRKFDLLTGEPTEVESINSFGQYFLSRSVPAYIKYKDMGPKISNSTNKNMLTQPTATYLYKSNGSGTTSGNPLQALVTTWTDSLYQHRDSIASNGRYVVRNPDVNKNIYHQHRTYVWKEDLNPDGTSKTFTDFDWTLTNINAKWIKTSEATLYDRYSHALEEKNINDQFASAKMDYKGRLAYSVATNAKYNESAFSGAEDYDAASDYFGGEIKKWSGTVTTTYKHTGHYSLQLNSGQYGFIYRPKVGSEISKGRTYRVRVWVYDNGGLNNKRLFYYFTDLNGSGVSDPAGAEKSADQYTIKAGNWVLLEIDIPIGTTSNYDNKYLELGVYSTNSSTGYFDDFRFHPIDGAMTSFVYDKDTDLLTYILDAENMYTQYIYDAAGRLTQVYRETTENPQGKRLVSKHEYHYARPTN